MKKEKPRQIFQSFFRGGAFAAGFFVTGLLAVTLTGTINTFQSGEVVSAALINENFSTLRTAIESTVEPPVGTINAWHKTMTGTPALPDGWVECDGQTISDSDSPYDGLAVPNLNGKYQSYHSRGVFLRGDSSSGSFENDAFQGHFHRLTNNDHVYRAPVGGSGKTTPVGGTSSILEVKEPTNDGTNGSPRTAAESRPVNMSVVWIIRIK